MSGSLRRRLEALERPSAAMSIDIAEMLREARHRAMGMTLQEIRAEQQARVVHLTEQNAARKLDQLGRRMLAGLERVLAA